MWPPVLPFVKAAVVAGTVSGAGDSVLQWARGLQYSRVKRRGRIDSWDAIRSTQVAIVAAAVGPILVVPTVLAGPGLEDLLSAAAGIALVEAGLLPFFYCWREDLLFSFKSNIPRLVVIGTTYTLGISLVTAYSLDHLPSLTSLGQLGALMPEGVVWTAGLGLTAFFLYAFAHQTALSMETNLGKDRDPLIGRAKLVGVLCSASLLGLVVLDMPEFPLAHLFLTDVFWMSGMVYQCFLTYIQSLETERSKAQAKASKGNKGGFDVAAHLRLRTLLNVAMVGGTLAYRPFESSGQESVAMGLKGFVSLCWLAYFLTFDKEYEPFDGDAGNWALVSTDEEERARRRRRQTKAEHAAQRREPKEKRKAEREAQQREAEKVPESSTPSSSTDPESAEDDAEGVERGHRRGGESGRKAAAENSSSRPTTAGRPASDGGGRSGLRTTPGGRRPRTGERPAPLRKGSPPPSSPSSREGDPPPRRRTAVPAGGGRRAGPGHTRPGPPRAGRAGAAEGEAEGPAGEEGAPKPVRQKASSGGAAPERATAAEVAPTCPPTAVVSDIPILPSSLTAQLPPVMVGGPPSNGKAALSETAAGEPTEALPSPPRPPFSPRDG